jgi:HK97 gp10 family phage protein
MADGITISIEGLAELQTALRELPDATAKNVLRRVGKTRLAPMAERARQLAPVDQGELRDSIAVSTKLTRRQRSLHVKESPDAIEVFAGAGPHPQAHMQEYGTEHNAPQPFMRPAWDAERDGVLEGIKDDLWQEIEKAANRLARKRAKAAR